MNKLTIFIISAYITTSTWSTAPSLPSLRDELLVQKQVNLGNVDEEWKMFKEVLSECAGKVCGEKKLSDNGIGEVVKSETDRSKVQLLQNKDGRICERFELTRTRAKRMMREAMLGENLRYNKWVFWKEVKRMGWWESVKHAIRKDKEARVKTEKNEVCESYFF